MFPRNGRRQRLGNGAESFQCFIATGQRQHGTGRHDNRSGLRAKTRRSGPACYEARATLRDVCPMKQLARWISILAHPFTMVVLLVAVPAMHQSSGHAFQSVLLVAIALVVPIAVLMF